MKSHTIQNENHDLDLLPVMNLFSILIPFLLSVAVFQKLAIVEVDMPPREAGGFSEPEVSERLLAMTLFLTENDVKIWAWDQPWFEKAWTWETRKEERVPIFEQNDQKELALGILKGKLEELHNRGIDMSDASNAVLVANPDIPTQQVIQLMDILKESGFHNINMASLMEVD